METTKRITKQASCKNLATKETRKHEGNTQESNQLSNQPSKEQVKKQERKLECLRKEARICR